MPKRLDQEIAQLAEAMQRVANGERKLQELQAQIETLHSRGEMTEEAERVLSALGETVALWRVHCELLEDCINRLSARQ